MTRFISQDSVAAAATEIVKTAEASIDITGAWITGSALRLLLQSIRPNIEKGQLKIDYDPQAVPAPDIKKK